MGSFNIGQGGVISRPGGHGVPELMRTDGPSFSLCAAPLELSGPGFHGVEQRLDERAEVWCILDRSCRRGLVEGEGRIQGSTL